MNNLTKILIIAILFWAAASGLTANITLFYYFNYDMQPYTEITGTPIPSIQGDDQVSTPLDIGFSFPYGLQNYSQVRVSSNGYLALGFGTGSAIANALISNFYCPVIAPLWDDLDMTNGNVQYLLTETAPQRIFTIQYQNAEWNYNATNQYNFQVKLFENGRIEMLYGTYTGAPVNPSASIGINMQPGGDGNFYSVTPGNPATVSWSEENNLINAFPASGTKYIFNPPAPVPADLTALVLEGNHTPTQGVESVYDVTIRNMGTASQNTYTVKLMTDETELASAAGIPIAPGQTLQVQVPWIPQVDDITQMYAKVALPDDAYPLNDATGSFWLTIQTEGTYSIFIGAGDQTARIPLDFFWEYSLYETLYYPAEINAVGSISGLKLYKSSWQSGWPDKHIQLWMGETTLPDLSGGWIPSTQLTPVFDGNIDFPFEEDEILIPFSTDYIYTGTNLVLLVKQPYDGSMASIVSNFYCQTVGTNRARLYYSDSTDPNPANPPVNSTLTGQFPRTTFYMADILNGALQGTVSSGGNPLSGASVVVENTSFQTTTDAAGSYGFPFLPAGTHQVTVALEGYLSQTQTAVITDGQTTALNFNLVPVPEITISGQIRGADIPDTGLAEAVIIITGGNNYTSVTDAQGMFSIPGVLTNQNYQYRIMHTGYVTATGELAVGTSDLDMGIVILSVSYAPPNTVQASLNASNTAVNIIWNAPGTGEGEWLSYCDDNNDSIGTGGVADFDVAIRFPASALQDYIGMSLNTLNLWPAQAGTFSARVWTGGTATAPGTLVVDQAFTPVLDQYNAVTLATPVPITGNEELWFGYRCNVTSGYPAGCDAGPAIDGYGNMMFWQGAWTTLLALAPTLNYNWNIQGYVSFNVPTRITQLQPLNMTEERLCAGTLAQYGKDKRFSENTYQFSDRNQRSLLGYKVWRLLQGQESNEAAWSLLTPNIITATAYTDGGYPGNNTFKWAVKAIYTGNIASIAAFSNSLGYPHYGHLTGTVRNSLTMEPVEGAEITLVGSDSTATTDTAGYYYLTCFAGIYTVNATATGYADTTFYNVGIPVSMTTTLDINLRSLTANQDNILTPTALLGCYPNPFAISTTVVYQVKDPCRLFLKAYNLKGQLVKVLKSGSEKAGIHQISWDGKDSAGKPVSPGLYYLRLQAGNLSSTRKVLLLP